MGPHLHTTACAYAQAPPLGLPPATGRGRAGAQRHSLCLAHGLPMESAGYQGYLQQFDCPSPVSGLGTSRHLGTLVGRGPGRVRRGEWPGLEWCSLDGSLHKAPLGEGTGANPTDRGNGPSAGWSNAPIPGSTATGTCSSAGPKSPRITWPCCTFPLLTLRGTVAYWDSP